MTAARIYAAGEDGELTMDTLPETGFVKTFSNDSQVTDSAPSMSAYMTGVKMNNEVISMSADTRAIDPKTDPDRQLRQRQRQRRYHHAGAGQGRRPRHRRGDHHRVTHATFAANPMRTSAIATPRTISLRSWCRAVSVSTAS